MKKKLLAFALAGALGLTLLAGCGAGGGAPTPEGTPAPNTATPAPTVTATPKPTSEPGIPAPTPIPEPSTSPAPTPVPQPGGDTKPGESTKPSEKPAFVPSPVPEQPKPSESTKPAVSAVKSIWGEVSLQSRPALMDMDVTLLSDLYGIDSADLEEFVAKMPTMSASVSEFLIAKCAPGRVDAVKQACQERQAALAADDRYPETVKLAESYQLVTQGDYLLFAIDQHADSMVGIFYAYTK